MYSIETELQSQNSITDDQMKYYQHNEHHPLPGHCCQSTALQMQSFSHLLHCSLKKTRKQCMNIGIYKTANTTTTNEVIRKSCDA